MQLACVTGWLLNESSSPVRAPDCSSTAPLAQAAPPRLLLWNCRLLSVTAMALPPAQLMVGPASRLAWLGTGEEEEGP